MKPKKILSALLAVVMVVVMVPITSVEVDAETEGHYTYTVTDGCATITDVDTSISGDVAIPDRFGDYPVVAIGDYAFYWCQNLTSITIPDSVTSIGNKAFYYCTGLTNIIIPDSVTSIGDYAFSACDSLTSITAGSNNTVYKSDDGVLYTKDGSVLICYPAGKPDSTYTIHNGVTSIGATAFCGCDNITSVIIPDSVTSIGENAFEACFGLTSVTIPESVTTIHNNAFQACHNISKVMITNLEAWLNINFEYSIPESEGEYFVNANPMSYGGADLYLNGVPVTDLVIPESVTEIKDLVFDGCISLTNVIIPDGVTSIGDYAFYWCENLTSITIPDSVTSIGDRAFVGCNDLTMHCGIGSVAADYASSYDIPVVYTNSITAMSVATLPSKTTYPINGVLKLDGLTLNVTVDNGTETTITSGYVVGEYDLSTAGTKIITVYYGNLSVQFEVFVDDTLVEYPESDHPYENNTRKTWYYTHNTDAECLGVTFSKNTQTEYNWDFIYIYDSNDNLVGKYSGTELSEKTVIVPGNSFSIQLTSDSSGTYYGFSITNIEKYYADFNISNDILTKYKGDGGEVIIPDDVTAIGTSAFAFNNDITSVVIPEGVTVIQKGAFAFCENLETVVLPSTLETIDTGAFAFCPALSDIEIPESVTLIGDGAFDCCYALGEVYIRDTVETIGEDAFNGCTALTLRCYSTAPAATYAEENDVNYRLIISGDADDDGAMNLNDLVHVSKLANGAALETGYGADANRDGVVNLDDVTLISKMANGAMVG